MTGLEMRQITSATGDLINAGVFCPAEEPPAGYIPGNFAYVATVHVVLDPSRDRPQLMEETTKIRGIYLVETD